MADVIQSENELNDIDKNVSRTDQDIAKDVENIDKYVEDYVNGKAKEYNIDVEGMPLSLKIERLSLEATKNGKASDFKENIGEDIKKKLASYYEKSVEYANQKYEEVNKQIYELRTEIAKKLEQKQKINDEKKANELQIKELDKKSTELQKSIEQIDKEINDLKSEIDKFDAEHKYKKLDQNDINDRNALIDKLDSSNSKYQEFLKEQGPLEDKISDLKSRNSQIDKQLEGYKDLDQKAKKVSELEDKYKDQFKSDKERLDGLKTKLAEKDIIVNGKLTDKFIDISSKDEGKDKSKDASKEAKNFKNLKFGGKHVPESVLEKTAIRNGDERQQVSPNAQNVVQQPIQQQAEEKTNLPELTPKQKVLNFVKMTPEQQKSSGGIDSILPSLIELKNSGEKLRGSEKKQVKDLGKQLNSNLIDLSKNQNKDDLNDSVKKVFSSKFGEKDIDDLNDLFDLENEDNIIFSYKYMDDKSRKSINESIASFYDKKSDLSEKDISKINRYVIDPLKYSIATDCIASKTSSRLNKFLNKAFTKRSNKYYSDNAKSYPEDAKELTSLFEKNKEDTLEKDQDIDDFKKAIQSKIEAPENSREYKSKSKSKEEKAR